MSISSNILLLISFFLYVCNLLKWRIARYMHCVLRLIILNKNKTLRIRYIMIITELNFKSLHIEIKSDFLVLWDHGFHCRTLKLLEGH